MPKHPSLSKMQIEMNDEAKAQKAGVEAKRAVAAQKKARKEAIEEQHEEVEL